MVIILLTVFSKCVCYIFLRIFVCCLYNILKFSQCPGNWPPCGCVNKLMIKKWINLLLLLLLLLQEPCFPINNDNKTKIRKYVMEETFSVTICRTYNILYQGYRWTNSVNIRRILLLTFWRQIREVTYENHYKKQWLKLRNRKGDSLRCNMTLSAPFRNWGSETLQHGGGKSK